jgi:hypothetical protein
MPLDSNCSEQQLCQNRREIWSGIPLTTAQNLSSGRRIFAYISLLFIRPPTKMSKPGETGELRMWNRRELQLATPLLFPNISSGMSEQARTAAINQSA